MHKAADTMEQLKQTVKELNRKLEEKEKERLNFARLYLLYIYI